MRPPLSPLLLPLLLVANLGSQPATAQSIQAYVQVGSGVQPIGVSQSSAGNFVGIIQIGGSPQATVSQFGPVNAAGIGQAGSTTSATVGQTGSLNVSAIGQIGGTNAAALTQFGALNQSFISQVRP